MKRILAVAIAVLFILSAVEVYAAETALNQPLGKPVEKTKDRASRGMNNLLCGPVEMPDNISDTGTKGTAMDKCSTKTRSGVERGIARVVTGVWQLATFWYSDPGCVTSTVNGKAAGSSAAVETK